MSIFLEATATCGTCGNQAQVDLAASVNAARRPDLRTAILDGSFQAEVCAQCGGQMRLPAHLTYLDVKRGQWILVQTAEALENWQEEETEARKIFEQNFGAAAPKPSREIGADLVPRLVFGWPALREKLICSDLAVDDTTLELLKMSVMRNVAGAPIADQTELRLVGGEGDTLNFAWITTASEAPLFGLAVPREVYDDIASEPEVWAALRADFAGRMFVDLKRLVAG
jgi:hydrogenase maturation factor